MEAALDCVRPDEDLVGRCRFGDETAVRELTRRHNQRLFRIARSILRNDAEAEDVVQETYARAFTQLETFRGESGVGTWLVRIAMNEALGRLRRQRPTVEIDDLPATGAGDDPERVMVQRELRTLLERSIDSLPDAFRTVFVARIVEGLSIEETASLLGLRPETVKTRVHRARVRLRRAIEREVGPAWSQAFSFDGARCERLTAAVVQRMKSAEPASLLS